MRSFGGFAAIALATVGLTGTASSQEVPPEPEIANWAAPLLWRPPAKSDKEARPGHEVGAGLLSAEGTVAPHLPFVAMTPCRLVDTRPTSGFPANYGAPALVADATRDFDLNSAAHCPGIPADVVAYSLNVTVTQTQGFGDIRIWPTGNFALVSTQNWQAAGVTLANASIAPAGTDGSVTVQAAGSGTHLIIDINGYFGPFLDLLFVNEGQAGAIQPGMIDSDAVASEQIVDGTIVDADISALAAIDDTKISTIASAGKVADSALSSSVTLLGQTIEGGEITNITRSISIPLLAFMDCDTGSAAFLDFTSGAADRKADFTGIASGAEGFALHFDNDPGQEDQNTEICSQLVLPPDYVSGGQFRVLMQKGGHAGATETLNCAVGGNTSGIGGQGAVITTTNVSTIYTCAPPLPSLQAGDTLRISLKMTSDIVMDDLVLLYSVAFEYTASQ